MMRIAIQNEIGMPRSTQPPSAPKRPNSSWNMLLESRGIILGLCFLVFAVFGLPLIWLSPAFTQRQKLVWSIVVVIYTAVLIGIVAAIIWWAYTVVLGG